VLQERAFMLPFLSPLKLAIPTGKAAPETDNANEP
jgi:hypothetical protein